MTSAREICRKSLAALARPLVRFALRHSLRLRDVVEYLKVTFVDVAREELEKLGKEVTASKISAMTGIQRPEVSRLMKKGVDDTQDRDIITRVIGMWQNSKRFRDRSGKAKVLSNTGRDSEFAELVHSVSTDLNPYTVAFELERAGIVISNDFGLTLVKPGYESVGNIAEGLSLLAEDTDDLHNAVNENVFMNPAEKNLHVKTEFDNIPISKKIEVRRWFSKKGEEFQHQAREYLSNLDRDINPKIKKSHAGEPSIRAVLGTYSFTDEVSGKKQAKKH